jgi:hypothetical protein
MRFHIILWKFTDMDAPCIFFTSHHVSFTSGKPCTTDSRELKKYRGGEFHIIKHKKAKFPTVFHHFMRGGAEGGIGVNLNDTGNWSARFVRRTMGLSDSGLTDGLARSGSRKTAGSVPAHRFCEELL